MIELLTQNSQHIVTDKHKLSLYLHVPFCRTRCTYCDFNTYTNLSFLYDNYTRALCQEIERTLAAIAAGVYNPLLPLPTDLTPDPSAVQLDTIFFGGGTPSLLPPVLMDKIFASLHRSATFADNIEITLEANPGTLELNKLQAFKSIGINRLSFGVQTFDDEALRQLGRTHDSAGAVKAVELARQAGYDNFNLDFIYGLPGQTLDDWRKNLETAHALRPNHLSMYALTVEENTSLGRGVAAGKIELPEDDSLADMYELALAMNAAAGYQQYEISNWSLGDPAQNACKHNLVYWHNQPYIGVGPGAYSCYADYRYGVLRDPLAYVTHLRRGESVIETAEAEPVTPELKLADTVMLALRLNEGLELARIERDFGRSLEDLFPGKLEKLTSYGLLEQREGILRLTVRGRLLSNNVFMEFLPG